MMIKYIKSGFNFFQDEDKILSLHTIVFIALPIFYMIYLSINMSVLGIDIFELLTKSPTECLNLILKLSCLYAAYVVMEYAKNKESKYTILAYLLVLISQVLQGNIVTIVIMVFYVYHFIGVKEFLLSIRKCAWGKGISAFSSALALCLVSMLVLGLKLVIV